MTDPRSTFAGTDRFAVVRFLGSGGFGTVYEAYDRQRRALVALKILHRADAAGLFRLKREFRALADLSHPNLVSLYELLSEREHWFISMELVSGCDFLGFVRESDQKNTSTALAALLDENAETGAPTMIVPPRFQPVLSSGNLARLEESLRQLAEGLRYLHSAGKLHRDIKPSNVLVTDEGRVVLLDFGLVSELGMVREDASVVIAGTPAYMSPAEGTDEPITAANDWYSVGVMLFEALTGRLPFTGGFLDVMTAKHQLDAPEPRDFVADVPQHLNDLCRSLLSRNPEARLPAADGLLHLGSSERLPSSRLAPAASSTGAPFVGRTKHLDALVAAYEASKTGRAITVYVHGGSGMGKSALVRRFLQTIRERDADAILLPGRCFERESVPYKALDNLVDALTVYLRDQPRATAEAFLPRDVLALARLFPILRRVDAISQARQRVFEIADSQEFRRRAFAAFRELMARLSSRHPLVLFIDDLHWGDADSAALLTEMLHPPDAPPILLVAAYRTEEATSSVPLRMLLSSATRAAADGDVREVIVGELNRDEARSLAAALMSERDRSGWSEDAVVAESGGNPYFIDELARYSKSAEVTGEWPRDESATAPTGNAEITLDDVISARVRRLPDAARQMLEVLAVFGRPLDVSVASLAAGLSSRVLESLAVLRAERLSRTRVVEDREEIETYHDRIRETVVAHLEPHVLKAHHRALALALENVPAADPETLQIHFQHAGEHERAARYAIVAADHAADALAFDRSARLYRVALDLSPGEPAGRQRIRVKLGDALANAGRGRDAAHAYLAAVEGATAADRLELQRRAAEQLLRSGHIDEGFDAIRAVLATMGMRLAGSPRRAMISMLLRRLQIRLRGLKFNERDVSQISPEELVRIDACWSIAIGLGTVDNIRGADFQARHLLLALRTGEPYRITRALAIEVAYSSIPGGTRARRRSQELGEMAERLAERVGLPAAIGLVSVSRGTAAALLWQWKVALAQCERAAAILSERCTGVGWELAVAHFYSLVSLQYLGEFGELLRRLPPLIKEARERDDLNAVTNYRTRLSYLSYLASDEPEKASEEVLEGIGAWYQDTFTTQHYFELVATAEIALYVGDGASAWAHVERHWAALERSLLMRVQLICVEALFVRARSAIAAATMTGDDDCRADQLRAAGQEIRRLRRKDSPGASPLADLAAAGIATLTGHREEVMSLLENSAQAFTALDMSLHAAAARRRLGEVAGGERGYTLIAEADSWMRTHGIRNPERMTIMLAPGIYVTMRPL